MVLTLEFIIVFFSLNGIQKLTPIVIFKVSYPSIVLLIFSYYIDHPMENSAFSEDSLQSTLWGYDPCLLSLMFASPSLHLSFLFIVLPSILYIEFISNQKKIRLHIGNWICCETFGHLPPKAMVRQWWMKIWQRWDQSFLKNISSGKSFSWRWNNELGNFPTLSSSTIFQWKHCARMS